MKLLYSGKTKDVYTAANPDHVILQFKDDVTGENGVFDPGANSVGLTIEGAGESGLRMSTYFFEKLNRAGILTHFVRSDMKMRTMEVRKAEIFGKGLEVICRYRAVGSFFRRYGGLCKEGQSLEGLVEFTIKDDERGDPTISVDTLAALGILSPAVSEGVKREMLRACTLIHTELAQRGMDLYDIKLEFGRDKQGRIMVIDEISGGNMRVYRKEEYLEPLQLAEVFFADHKR